MRYRLKTDAGVVIVCNSPECVRLWMERGAELVRPADLDVIAKEQEEAMRVASNTGGSGTKP